MRDYAYGLFECDFEMVDSMTDELIRLCRRMDVYIQVC